MIRYTPLNGKSLQRDALAANENFRKTGEALEPLQAAHGNHGSLVVTGIPHPAIPTGDVVTWLVNVGTQLNGWRYAVLSCDHAQSDQILYRASGPEPTVVAGVAKIMVRNLGATAVTDAPSVTLALQLVRDSVVATPFARYGIAAGGVLQTETVERIGLEFDDYLLLRDEYPEFGVRLDCPWVTINPRAGVFDFTLVDNTHRLAHARGLHILGTLSYAPAHANGGDADYFVAPTNTAGRQKYAAAAAEYVQRYPYVRAIEAWNEPNLAGFYKPAADPAGYTELVQLMYEAVKAVRPEVIVVAGNLGGAADGGGSLSWGTFTGECYDEGIQGYFDAWSCHPYLGGNPPDAPFDWTWPNSGTGSWFGTDANSVRNRMVAHGDGDKQIWLTEVNDVVLAAQAAAIPQLLDLWNTYPYSGPAFIYCWRVESDNNLSLVDGTTFAHRAGWTAYHDYLEALV